MVGLSGPGDDHFTGLAVAGDLQQGVACLEVEVAGQRRGILALEACAELAADAVARVHQWGAGCDGCSGFEGG